MLSDAAPIHQIGGIGKRGGEGSLRIQVLQSKLPGSAQHFPRDPKVGRSKGMPPWVEAEV